MANRVGIGLCVAAALIWTGKKRTMAAERGASRSVPSGPPHVPRHIREKHIPGPRFPARH